MKQQCTLRNAVCLIVFSFLQYIPYMSLQFILLRLLLKCYSIVSMSPEEKITQKGKGGKILRFIWLTSGCWLFHACCCCTLVVWPVTYVQVHYTGKPFSVHRLQRCSFRSSFHAASMLLESYIFVDEKLFICFRIFTKFLFLQLLRTNLFALNVALCVFDNILRCII